MKIVKMVDPDTGKQIWCKVDENGNIIEKNVAPPTDELTEEGKQKQKNEEINALKLELENIKKISVMEMEGLKEANKGLMEMLKSIQDNMSKVPDKKDDEQEKEKIIYATSPEDQKIMQNLIQKQQDFDNYKAQIENEKYINAQIQAKPWVKEAVEKSGIKTTQDYIRIILPMESIYEENHNLKEKIANSHTKDLYDEYGIGIGTSKKTSAEDKIMKEGEDMASDLIGYLIR